MHLHIHEHIVNQLVSVHNLGTFIWCMYSEGSKKGYCINLLTKPSTYSKPLHMGQYTMDNGYVQ